MNNCVCRALCVVGGLWAVSAGAQSVANPADPAVTVPPARYDSAFAGFAPYREQKLAPWREVNDEVARVGGHVGVLRSDRGGTAKPPAAPRTIPGNSRSPK